jgi:predicted phosphodiesterase
MKTLIYSDVHGNLPAFERMLKIEGQCDSYICLGDLVNYGPWSNECVDLAVSLPNSIFVIGNHEEAFIQGAYPGENPLVQSFFQKCYANFDRKEIIKEFISEVRFNDFICTHTINRKSIYPDTTIQLDNNYIIGHSHHSFQYTHKKFTLYNAGSVGQNRKYINEINYLVYNTEGGKIDLKSTTYNLNLLLSEMENLNYPEECLNYYRSKKMR